MKKAIASMRALPGIHQHLSVSVEQKQDIAIAAVQTTRGAASAGAARLGGLSLSDWAVLATIAFVAQLAVYLALKNVDETMSRWAPSINHPGRRLAGRRCCGPSSVGGAYGKRACGLCGLVIRQS